MSEMLKVATASEVEAGACKAFEADGKTIVLYNVDGEFFATSSKCPHQGGPLGDGLVDGKTVTCPWHAWQFDLVTGEAIFDPGFKIDCFKVALRGDDILVDLGGKSRVG